MLRPPCRSFDGSIWPSTTPYFCINWAVSATESASTSPVHFGSTIDFASFGGIFALSDRNVRNSSSLAAT